MKYIFFVLSLLTSCRVLSVQMQFCNMTNKIIEIPIICPDGNFGCELDHHTAKLKPHKKDNFEIDQEVAGIIAKKIVEFNPDITVHVNGGIVEIIS